MPRVFINDGLTLDRTITPSDDYLPVKVTFRPPLADALMKHEELTEFPGVQRVDAVFSFVAAHLVSWDIVDQNDKPVSTDASGMVHVPPDYLWAIRKEICKSVEMFCKLQKN